MVLWKPLIEALSLGVCVEVLEMMMGGMVRRVPCRNTEANEIMGAPVEDNIVTE